MKRFELFATFQYIRFDLFHFNVIIIIIKYAFVIIFNICSIKGKKSNILE